MYNWIEKSFPTGKILTLNNSYASQKYTIKITEYKNHYRLNCSSINLYDYNLKVKNIDEAKELAIKLIIDKLDKTISSIDKLIKVLSIESNYFWEELDLKKMKFYNTNFNTIYKCEDRKSKINNSIKLYRNLNDEFILDCSLAEINNFYVKGQSIEDIQEKCIEKVLKSLDKRYTKITSILKDLK